MYPTREMLSSAKKPKKKMKKKARSVQRVTRDLSAHPARQREKKEAAFATKLGFG